MDTHDVGSQEKPETTKIPLVLEIKTKDLERPDDTIKNVTISLPNGLTAKFILSGSWLVAHDCRCDKLAAIRFAVLELLTQTPDGSLKVLFW
jgi:hypothetical protein